MQEAMSFYDVAIDFIKGNDHWIHFWYMSKDEALKGIKNDNLSIKSRFL